MMKKCKNCGMQMPGLALYCSNCGTKVESPVTYNYVEEDERDFAFHSEYYGTIGGNYPGHVWEHSCGCTFYDGVLYQLYEKDEQKDEHYYRHYYILKIEEDGNILDVFDLGKSEMYFYQLCSNRHGIFLVDKKCVFVYDFQGNKKCEIVFSEVFGEQYVVSDYYIFGSCLYAALYKKIKKGTISELGICVQAYDFITQRLEMVWSLVQGAEELEDYAKSQLRGQMEVYGGGKDLHRTEQVSWAIITEPTVCVNSQYAVISYELSAASTDGNDYEIYINPILVLDFKTGCCEDIKGVHKSTKGFEKMRLDMLRNRIWFPREDKTCGRINSSLGFQIRNWREIDLDQYEDIWKFDINTDHFSKWEKCYFDGEHAYMAFGDHFYAYQKDGSRAVEWNRSGLGQGRCTVLGPYLFAVFGQYGKIVRHSIQLPEDNCFDWDREIADEMIRRIDTKQTKTVVKKAAFEESGESDEKAFVWEGNDTVSGNPISNSTFDNMSILQLRTLLQNSSKYSEQFGTFRKNLKDDKWDFNAVMGILLGSRKRHATGPRHIQEQNAGIGQGDNKDMVVVTLNQYGMMDIYEKYEKVSAPDIMVAQAVRDICERNPKLTYICDAIRTILQ